MAKKKLSIADELKESRQRVAALTGMICRVCSVFRIRGITQEEKEHNLNIFLYKQEKENSDKKTESPF